MARFSHLIFAVFLAVIISACGELSDFENQQVEEALSDSLLSLTESWGVDMDIMEEGQLKLNLKGSYTASIKTENRHLTKISGPVFIEIFDEEGNPKTYVNSDSAVYKPDESIFELFGSVYVEAPEEKRLWSEYLKWERNIDKVSTPEFLIIVTPTDSITAIGLDGDADLTNYTLREVTGETVVN
ncbi:MAG: LPS export ABC transporter periplasmic protein LptC [Gracilimonas sp.]